MDLKKSDKKFLNNKDFGDWKSLGCAYKIKYVIQNITVEPILAIFQISSVLSSLTTQNLNLQKACRVNLNMSREICSGLENKSLTHLYKKESIEVQQIVANVLIWQTVIQSSIPCILIIFIGSWSDRNNKRKPFMLLPIFGEIVRTIGLLLCVYYFYEFPIEVAGLVESLPTAIGGGVTVLYLATFSYIGDKCTVKNRTIRIGLLSMFFGSAFPIGASLSGVLYQNINFYGVYCLSLFLYIISLLYCVIRIKEQPQQISIDNVEHTLQNCMYYLREFFNLKHIRDTFAVTFKKEPYNRWVTIMMLLVIVVTTNGPSQGEQVVGYMYTRLKFNWNELDYSLYSTLIFILNLIGLGITLVILCHIFKMDEALIGAIAVSSKIMAEFVYAFATTEFIFYIGIFVETMSGASIIVVRSILTKTVQTHELDGCMAIIG
ncbi:uncharacterized protein LOC126904197 isoform X2 [Daktulosphaira vitifoliae]|uniref:uncharacterized protein LOC126904197 isoform X2 n=1 Tax=Daktulosphaira vitifoliae TaxID=58002 RepID=UPI0021A9DF6E|nr:uncharacterized protein LOC126904197 isoform X2 [Daktulosphaira vitifoliae]